MQHRLDAFLIVSLMCKFQERLFVIVISSSLAFWTSPSSWPWMNKGGRSVLLWYTNFLTLVDVQLKPVIYGPVRQRIDIFLSTTWQTFGNDSGNRYIVYVSSMITRRGMLSHRRGLLYVCSMNYTPPNLLLSRERTTTTSETSENTIFVWFYSTLCYLMPTVCKWKVFWLAQPWVAKNTG